MTHETLEERVGLLERGLDVLVATRGTLRLAPAHVALAWVILLSLLGVAGTLAGTVWQQREQSATLVVQGKALIAISDRLDSHMVTIGHPVMLERVTQMRETLNEVRAIVKANAQTLNRVKKEKEKE